MKIIERDNYGRKEDRLVAENLNEKDAKRIVRLLNQTKDNNYVYYQVVSDSWK